MPNLIRPIYYVNEDDLKFNITRETTRGLLNSIHISDIHFGVINPKTQYYILKEQFIDKIKDLKIIDIISIDGDLFDHKFMSNTDSIMYATKFIADLVSICKDNDITLVIINGTNSHDAGQLKLFYHYLQDNTIDIRIVETICFEYIKGAKILCIPELYGIDENVYRKYLFESGLYDQCFMHGTIKGAVYGDNVGQGRLFTIDDFINCKGPIIAGHIHTGGCFNTYFYYNGSPIRWQFGEEGNKGFLIVLYNMDTRKHYTHLEVIESFRYDTINLDELVVSNPEDIIKYINTLKKDKGIDHLRVEFTKEISSDNENILKAYYKNNGSIKLKLDYEKHKNSISMDKDSKELDMYSYIFDNSLSEYDKLARFIIDNEGKESSYITGDKIKEILQEV